MIELMDLSKVAKRSQSERGSTQREHFLLDHEGLKVYIYQPVMLFAGRPFVFYLHLLSTFFFFFFFFLGELICTHLMHCHIGRA